MKDKTVKDIMTTAVITVTPDTSIRELVELLGRHNINGVPVVDEGGKLVGIVTEADVVDQSRRIHIPSFFNFMDSVIFLEDPSVVEKEIKKMTGTKVGDIMTTDVRTVTPDTTVQEVATLMSEEHIQTIPVMDGERLVGVVGRWDVIKSIV